MPASNRTLRTVLDAFETNGCPLCGSEKQPSHVLGPDAIVLECGHVVDARDWIDSHHPDAEPDASELEDEDG